MTRPAFNARGLLLAAGEAPGQKAATVTSVGNSRGAPLDAAPHHHNRDATLPGATKRACANCRRKFKPTLRRRMLCSYCFSNDAPSLIG